MLARFYHRITAAFSAIFNFAKNFLAKIKNDFFSFDPQKLSDNAALDPQGVSTAQIGIWPFVRHIVYISPNQSPAVFAQFLDQFMNLQGSNTRRMYRYFNFLTGAVPFLELNNASALQLRKTRIIPYLVPKNIHADTQSSLIALFKQFNNSTAIRNHESMHKMLTHHVFDFFLHTLLDAEMDADMKESLMEIDQSLPMNVLFGITPDFILNLLNYVPSIKSSIQHYDQLIKKFLRMQIDKMLHSPTKDNTRRNWWHDVIRDKFPDKNPHELSPQDIDELTKDPDIRMSVTIVIGVKNIALAISTMYHQFFYSSTNANQEFLARLTKEIETQKNDKDRVAQKDLTNKERMPLLHAVYLEILRHSGSQQSIARYTDKSITLNNTIHVPANSLVVLQLSLPMKMFSTPLYPRNGFHPQRFLDAKGQLTEEANNALDLFHTFGIGPRICPARHITEVFCKNYIVGFAQHISRISLTHQITFKESKWFSTHVLGQEVEDQEIPESASLSTQQKGAANTPTIAEKGFFAAENLVIPPQSQAQIARSRLASIM